MEQVVGRGDKFLDREVNVERAGKHHHERTRKVTLAPDHRGNDDARHYRKEPDDEFNAQNHVLYLAQLGTSRILLFFHITNIKNCASYSV
jgi:hypothetical protein